MALRLFFYFSLLGAPALAGLIPQEDCLEKNFSGRFGPLLDQGDSGYCWAFAAAGLVEEHLCKSNRVHCGKSLSRLDISSCDFRFANESRSQAGYTQDAVSCALENGVCEERFAPFDLNFRRQETSSELPGAQAEANEHLRKMMVSSECRFHRLKVPVERVDIVSLFFSVGWEENKIKRDHILKSFREGRSWSAGVCLEKWRRDRDVPKELCDRHSVVVDGMRWNRNLRVCELHVRNSVSASDLSNWVAAERLIGSIFSIVRIGSPVL